MFPLWPRVVAVVVVVLVAVIVGLFAMMLALRDQKRLAVCVAAGATAFAGALTLQLLVLEFLQASP
jgi:hypothetical protein